MPTLSQNARALLRQHLTDNFSQADLEELAFDMGLDTETLLRETKSEFARALILYFEDRDDIERLAHEVLARRPDPILEQDLKNIETQAGAPSPATPADTSRPQSTALKTQLLIPVLLALVVLALVFVLFVLRQSNGNGTSNIQPSTAINTLHADIASDVPGTLLELNQLARSGVDNTAKPRDVWRVRLEAQQPYTIEIRSSVQDGIGAGLLKPGTSRVPDTPETADVNICSDASNCFQPFTPPLTGDYYIVIYGMRPLVNYDLTVHDKP